MSLEKKKIKLARRRAVRTRVKLRSADRPRVSVFRSANHIYGQVIDDVKHVTVASYSSMENKALSGDKKVVARAVGIELAKRAIAKGVTAIVFDRGPFLYHGRVRELAEGLREGGLSF